jgi:Flp pilus assembly protein TadG
MEMGRGVWTFTTIAHAARAGARYAIIHGALNPIPNDGTTIEDVVKADAVGLDPADVTVLTKYERYDEVGGTWQTGSSYNERSNVVEVKVNYPFRLVTGGLVLAQNTHPALQHEPHDHCELAAHRDSGCPSGPTKPPNASTPGSFSPERNSS